eukprot:TRINITY_DN5053_c0_g1_i2.p1 TRINITY_DN5053_c0_g1~~TRINITY_DN5053_c0_g1_i2.p1  ORF type:complete len:970 (+),score=168.65 TRINITY_DN5053_c0_g1_i2:171-3080(+)
MWCCFASFGKTAFVISLLGALFVDLVCCIVAYCIQHGSTGADGDEASIEHGSVDILFLFTLRLLLAIVGGPVIISSWQRRAFPSYTAHDTVVRGAPLVDTEMRSNVRAALRADEDMELARSGAGLLNTVDVASVTTISGSCAAGHVIARCLYEKKMEERKRMDAADFLRNILLAVGFAFSSCISVYIGLKCVVFQYDRGLESIQVVLLSFVLFLTNFEFFLLSNVVFESTKDEGELLPALHMHPLYFAPDLQSHYCDNCEEEMRGPGYEAFRCRTCHFDLCARCYTRKDKPDSEGAILPKSGDQALTTWGFFRRIVLMALDFWRLLSMTIGSLVAAQLLHVAAPNIQGQMFDSIIMFLQGKTDSDVDFTHAITAYIVITVLQGLFLLTTEIFTAKIQAAVRDRLFMTIVRMHIGFFDAVHSGQLISRLTNDIAGMVEPLQNLMNDMLANVIVLVGGAGMAFYTSWKLSILALTVVPPITVSYGAYARWGGKLNRSIYQYMASSSQVATEALGHIRTVHAFSTEGHESARFREGVNAALKAGVKNSFVEASVSALSTYVNLAMSVLILWHGGTVIFKTHGKDLSIGNLIAFKRYWNMINLAVLQLSNVFNDLIRASSAAERVFTLLDSHPEVDPDVGEDIDPRSIVGSLELQNIRFRYKSRPEREVLKGISLTLGPGSTTALVGKSGGGKSTLVHLLMRFYDPDEGSIILDGRDLKTLKSSQVRQAVGFVAQDSQLFSTSIEANIAYGIGREYTKEELHAAARSANAHEFITDEEEGYETRVGENGVRLSGGQKQRLAIARCFLRRPKLLFLDEATSALDTENEALVQIALEKLIVEAKSTVVLIAHRLSTVMNATQIAVLHKGVVAELGNHQDLVDQGGIYAQLVARQMQRDEDKINDEDDNHRAASANLPRMQRGGSSAADVARRGGARGKNGTTDNVDALFGDIAGSDGSGASSDASSDARCWFSVP